MDVEWILERQRQKIKQFNITANGKRREEEPRSYESIDIEYSLKGESIRRDAVERAIRLSLEKYCSVKAMTNVKLNITYRIAEDNKPEEKYLYKPTQLDSSD